MNCGHSSSINIMQGGVQLERSVIEDNMVVSRSVPSMCRLIYLSYGRAASFPMAHATAFSGILNGRFQSESAGLNTSQFETPNRVLSETQIKMLEDKDYSNGDGSLTSNDSGHTSEDEQSATESTDNSSNDDYFSDHKCPSKQKKVRFADDCGCILENIRVITESSDIPPIISPSIIRRYRQGSKAFSKAQNLNINGYFSNDENSFDDDVFADMYHNKKHSSWKIGFNQPASEHVKFRETLEKQKVALENVILRNDRCEMLGTIKVVNIAFDKHVFVRYTFNQWKNHLDCPAIYQPSPSKSFDVFQFEFEIPMNEGEINKIDFCICYKTGESEYWDSNDGKNYSIISNNQPIKPAQISSANKCQNSNAYKIDYGNCDRFLSWNDSKANGPYW